MGADTNAKVNIRHFLIMALGSNQRIHEYIDSLYEEKKWEYYECYQKSLFKKDIVVATFTTKNEERMRKVVGITEWCYEHNKFDDLFRLIKRGYKFAYQYVQHRTYIDLDQFDTDYAKKRGGSNFVTDLELFNNNVIVIYLCYKERKPCNVENVTGEIVQQGFIETYQSIMLYENNYSEKNIKRYESDIEELKSHFPFPKKMDEKMNLSRLFEYGIDKQTEEDIMNNRFSDPFVIRGNVFKKPYFKEIGALSGWIKTFRINEMDLAQCTPITQKDIDVVLAKYLIAKKENHITDDQKELFIVACLYIQSLIKQLHETKQLYLDQSQEDYYIDVKKREEETQEKERELQRVEKERQMELDTYKRKVENLEKELRKTKENVKKQEKKTQSMEDYSKEVNALRTYIYEKEKVELKESPVSVEQMIDSINKRDMAIFGGHPNWQQKMKEVLPTLTFIDVDELNKDISFVDRKEMVFINTAVFNHSFYRKLMTQMAKNDTKLYYLNESGNIERTITQMYEIINNH